MVMMIVKFIGGGGNLVWWCWNEVQYKTCIKNAHDLGVGVRLFVLYFFFFSSGISNNPPAGMKRRQQQNSHTNLPRSRRKAKRKKTNIAFKTKKNENISENKIFIIFSLCLLFVWLSWKEHHTQYNHRTKRTIRYTARENHQPSKQPSSQSSSPPQAESTRKQAIRRNWNRWGSWFFAFIECK